MTTSTFSAYTQNFMGNSPLWYKQFIIGCLIVNAFLFSFAPPFISGWILLLQFIVTLAMALKCYPLQPGGLLAIEAIIFGMTSTDTVLHEVENNLEVILLLMFMVAGVYFMKDMLLYIFTKLFIKVRSKLALSLMFSFLAAIMSAFLDALTVTAVLIAVFVGFYSVFHKFASGKHVHHDDHDHGNDEGVQEYHRSDLDQFRSFMRSLVMHGAVGTALGGVCTQVGEPQNVVIATIMGWNFIEFFLNMAHITMPTLVAGLLTVIFLEKTKWFGYGEQLPKAVYDVLVEYDIEADKKRNAKDYAQLIIQMIVFFILVLALSFHVAAVGLIGLMIIVLLTTFNGITDEHSLGHAFEEGLPFTSLLVVFFAIIAVIHDQHLFNPVIDFVMSMDEAVQAPMFFVANGVLSMISDNVFVATVYIGQVRDIYESGAISREHYDALAVAINTGTNLPSVATPNGQAAFLFLLTSALAPLIRLSYGKMVWMALPYTFVLGSVGLLAVIYL